MIRSTCTLRSLRLTASPRGQAPPHLHGKFGTRLRHIPHTTATTKICRRIAIARAFTAVRMTPTISSHSSHDECHDAGHGSFHGSQQQSSRPWLHVMMAAVTLLLVTLTIRGSYSCWPSLGVLGAEVSAPRLAILASILNPEPCHGPRLEPTP